MCVCMAVRDNRAPGEFCNDSSGGIMFARKVCAGGISSSPLKLTPHQKNVLKNQVNNPPHPEGTAGRGVIHLIFLELDFFALSWNLIVR